MVDLTSPMFYPVLPLPANHDRTCNHCASLDFMHATRTRPSCFGAKP